MLQYYLLLAISIWYYQLFNVLLWRILQIIIWYLVRTLIYLKLWLKRKENKKLLQRALQRKPTTKKVAVKKPVVVINAENVGFKAGDVYNALAAEAKALSVSEIAKVAKITEEEVYLGIGWLFKEGKVKDENSKIVLA